MANMAQDRAYRGRARIDVGVNPKRPHKRHERRIVDQRHSHRTPSCLGTHSRQHIGFVIIGNGQNGVGAIDIRFAQQRTIKPVAMKHDCALKRVCSNFGNAAIFFDDFRAHTRFARL